MYLSEILSLGAGIYAYGARTTCRYIYVNMVL